ncbi:aminocarboxymuconate-semialdehyde decarboxylase [Acrasis kona]|uniref:2-amino-3-carboxymuconate-6-semialdehyde decarboxylase n=1 Tax=Acrasis kona TaxID=1008807 RepID=A0AAW2YSX0_9EUKA
MTATDCSCGRIDTHTHILPETWPDLNKMFGYGGFIALDHHKPKSARMMKDGQCFREIEDNCWNPETRIEEMRKTNVTKQILSTVPVMFNYWAKPKDTLKVSTILNDHIHDVCNQYEDSFVGLGTVPMQAPDLACKELRRCMEELGMKGIEIGTHVNKQTLDDPSMFPIFETAAELGATIFVHPWDMIGKDLMKKYWMPWLVGMPAETTLAMCSLMMGGVMEKLPNLKFCFAHGGGAFPFTVGRIEHGWNVRPDLCQTDSRTNPRDFFGKFWVDSLVHDPKAFKYLVDVVGDDKVVLGSDYPFPLGELRPGELIEKSNVGFSREQKDKMLYHNAVDCFNLSKN